MKTMAFYQIICMLIILVSLTKGDLTMSNWTTVYRFLPLSFENNYIVLEPKTPNTNSTGYSICLRVSIWRWSYTVLLDSLFVKLAIQPIDLDFFLCFSILKDKDKGGPCFLWENVSSEWNSLCITHNFKDFVLNITLNGIEMGSQKKKPAIDFMEKLTNSFSIGLATSLWGQITDFNIWNRPLTIEEVHQYSFDCLKGLSMQPQILDWFTANITKRGNNSLAMHRALLNCHSDIEQSPVIFDIAYMVYSSSVELCNLLNGKLVEPMYLGQFNGDENYFWVPKSDEFGNNTQNSLLTTAQAADGCMIVDLKSNEYFREDCGSLNPSTCKVVSDGKSSFIL
jgi:hypothetical protein